MRIARRLPAAALVLFASTIAGSAIAQPSPPSTLPERDRYDRDRDLDPDHRGSYDEREQVPYPARRNDRGETSRDDSRDPAPTPDRRYDRDPEPYPDRRDDRDRAPYPDRDDRGREPYVERRERARPSGDGGAAEQVRLLQDALDRYRDIERRGGWKNVPTDLPMGPGYSYDCQRLGLIEKRLIIEGFLDRSSVPPPPPSAPLEPGAPPPPPRPVEPMGQAGPCPYGAKLTDAVRAFQKARDVNGDGQVGAMTMVELNRPVRDVIDILEQDLARWRHVSPHPSGTYLLVNIPFFELIAYERGSEKLRMPVVTGLPSWQTPLFSDELETIIVNPDWGIPESIAKKEIWPLGKRNPKYFASQGITVSGGSLRQKPGPNNPLGRIKFVMPNEHDVYLHDTPHKNAFEYHTRSFSHGCIRLGRPMDLAHYLLRSESQWSPERLQKAVASKATQHIALSRHMPVHIVYSTSRVNDAGHVEFRDDVYSKNRKPLRRPDSRPKPDLDQLDTGP